jgi:hypothetical protein
MALRNLGDLLRGLGDDEIAAQLDAAADPAPDAPAPDRPTGTAAGLPTPHREAILDLTRQAIERHSPPAHLVTHPTR